MKRRLHLTFPEHLVQEPVIYNLAKEHDIVTNIRRANVEDRFGWMILEVEGDEAALDAGIASMRALGVQVEPIDGDVIAG